MPPRDRTGRVRPRGRAAAGAPVPNCHPRCLGGRPRRDADRAADPIRGRERPPVRGHTTGRRSRPRRPPSSRPGRRPSVAAGRACRRTPAARQDPRGSRGAAPCGGARRARAPPAMSAVGSCRPTPSRPTRHRCGRTRRARVPATRARCPRRPPLPSRDRARRRRRGRRFGIPARARGLRRARARRRAPAGHAASRGPRARSRGRSPTSPESGVPRAARAVRRSRPRVGR